MVYRLTQEIDPAHDYEKDNYFYYLPDVTTTESPVISDDKDSQEDQNQDQNQPE